MQQMLGNKNVLEGRHLRLRLLKEEDVSEAYCRWLNDPEVNRYLETKKTSLEELRMYVRQKREDPGCLFFGIFLSSDGRHVGNVKLEPIDWEHKMAVLGILIGEKDCWGKGVGQEAMELLVGYTFTELGMEAIELGVLAQHQAAIRLYQKMGFVETSASPSSRKMVLTKMAYLKSLQGEN